MEGRSLPFAQTEHKKMRIFRDAVIQTSNVQCGHAAHCLYLTEKDVRPNTVLAHFVVIQNFHSHHHPPGLLAEKGGLMQQ